MYSDDAYGPFFVHGFTKNEKDNIGKDELAALKKLATELLAYDDKDHGAMWLRREPWWRSRMMRKQYRSPLMASIHETAEGLHAAGAMDKRTMREFDEICLTPVRRLRPKEIRALRLRERASQAVFARYLNVSTGLVSQWERGEKHPQGASLKLLFLVAKKGLEAVA